jgi:hypothetical protein
MRYLAKLFLIIFLVYPCCAFHKLTILTQPLRSSGWAGHPGVNRSLQRGLSLVSANYNFNPSSIDDIGDVLYVPANFDALRIGIELKSSGRIKLLLAGPNLVVRPVEENAIITHPMIDCCIQPSEWVKIFYEKDAPSLRGRLAVWPAGVDTSFWQPNGNTRKSKNVLVYNKYKDEVLCSGVEQLLRTYGWIPYRLTYDHYNQNEYKNVLSHVRFAVFLSRTESQGIALAECWSMNIPTLVWDIQEPFYWGDAEGWPISSAPYLTAKTGKFWRNLDELGRILKYIDITLAVMRPRSWVLKNMSDEVSTQRLLAIINDLEAKL